MGTFTVAVEIGTGDGRWDWLEALVDTGASHSWVPRSTLEGLDLTPRRTLRFMPADGRRFEREMTEARVRYGGEEVTTLVVFGDEGTQALLGAYTLEGPGLAVDPVNQRLVPCTGLVM